MSDIDCITLDGSIKRIPESSLILRPAAYGILLNQHRILLMRMRHTGKYHLPGGGLNIGETLETTLKREVMEETGVEIDVHQLVHFKEAFFYYDPSGKAYHGLHFYYRCTPRSLALIRDDQVNDSAAGKPRWIELDTLKAEDFQLYGNLIIELSKMMLS